MREDKPERPSIFAETNVKTGLVEIHLSEKDVIDLLEILRFAHSSTTNTLKMLSSVPDMAPEKLKTIAAMALAIDDMYQKMIAVTDPGWHNGELN